MFALTRRRDLAFVGGLVFGFHPFRADHLPHLELLASFWLPLVFLALHRAVDTGRTAWHVALAASLIGTAFTTGYYFFYAGVLIGIWLVWFVPWDWPIRRYARLAVALVVPFVPLAPVLLRYRHAHSAMGLSRTITDIETFSADLRGFLTPPDTLWLWSAPPSWHTPEGAVFPGVAAVVTVLAALLARPAAPRDHESGPSGRPTSAARLRAACLVIAAAAAAVALVPRVFGSVAFDIAGLRVSVSQAYKPISVAVVFVLVWALTSRTVGDAWRRRSRLGFYALATLVAWGFALGPTARLAGERVLYKAPYAWLMVLPGFAEGFRAPARFVMLGALMLAVAAAVAAGRLGERLPARTRRALTAVLAVAVLADGWVWPFPTAPVPAPLEIPAGVPPDAVVMELPMGVFEDAAAMYRATLHEHPSSTGSAATSRRTTASCAPPSRTAASACSRRCRRSGRWHCSWTGPRRRGHRGTDGKRGGLHAHRHDDVSLRAAAWSPPGAARRSGPAPRRAGRQRGGVIVALGRRRPREPATARRRTFATTTSGPLADVRASGG